MKSIYLSGLLGAALCLLTRAEPNHPFPPLKPEEMAKIDAALPTSALAAPLKPRQLLVFYRTEGFVHGCIPYANEALKRLGEKTGAYRVTLSEDMAVFTRESLAAYDAVLFNNTTQLKFEDLSARAALLEFVQTGHGVIGIHAATDNFPTWPEGRALLGGKFQGHPWTSGDIEAVKVDDPEHPLNAPFRREGFWINDEIYQITESYSRAAVRVLLSLDMSKPQNQRDPKKIVRTDNDFPISWIKTTPGGGRVYYCSLGHNVSIFSTPAVLQHYLNGIQFALGDLSADSVPSEKLSPAPVPALAPEVPLPLNPPPPKKTVSPTPTLTPKP